MQKLIFYNECPGHYIILRDFPAGLGATMMKTINHNEIPSGKAQIAYNMVQSIDKSQTDCKLSLCTWHTAEAIKKNRLKPGSYPLEIRKDLT